MKIAKPISDLLARHRINWVNPADHPCEGAKHHSPRPLSVTRFNLRENKSVYLCPTCLDNVKQYIFLSVAEQGLDWNTERAFGTLTRQLANQRLDGDAA